ncbi:unnamed protein product [Microthlaspi erraticum]|uniref:Uncharacterized protein n=1 Tax=Microthlaspi erraticum TaxID=1685480 RepID=A0A6D2K0B0_9BRAS|nr:unnamed protein product [Microthlaspi erraticum]
MTLFPTKFENGKIEYKIRYKGRSRPFSRAKALVTSEQSRDPTKLKELLSQVLTITLDGPTSRSNKFKMLRGEGKPSSLEKKERSKNERKEARCKDLEGDQRRRSMMRDVYSEERGMVSNEEGSDETESEEEGEEVNQELRSEQENQDEAHGGG